MTKCVSVPMILLICSASLGAATAPLKELSVLDIESDYRLEEYIHEVFRDLKSPLKAPTVYEDCIKFYRSFQHLSGTELRLQLIIWTSFRASARRNVHEQVVFSQFVHSMILTAVNRRLAIVAAQLKDEKGQLIQPLPFGCRGVIRRYERILNMNHEISLELIPSVFGDADTAEKRQEKLKEVIERAKQEYQRNHIQEEPVALPVSDIKALAEASPVNIEEVMKNPGSFPAKAWIAGIVLYSEGLSAVIGKTFHPERSHEKDPEEQDQVSTEMNNKDLTGLLKFIGWHYCEGKRFPRLLPKVITGRAPNE